MNNPFTLEGKNILITGASSGIGRATAIACAEMGAVVHITGRNQEKLHETFNSLNGEGHSFFCADLSQKSGINSLIEYSPPLDGFVNNAGMIELLPVDFLTLDKLEKTLAVNTFAPVEIFTGLLKRRKLLKNSSVVFTSSLAGNFVTAPAHSAYALSKAALSAFAKSAALEVASRKIRVNCVCPGMIDTDLIRSEKITPEMLAEDAKRYPLKRYGKPEEVAYSIVFLLSSAASFITGTNLIIDGGMTLM